MQGFGIEAPRNPSKATDYCLFDDEIVPNELLGDCGRKIITIEVGLLLSFY
ncbi:unnamed protein product, partial [Vitis vinifera]|uniref:Uncharacterized protein n=1 Tax=Vitis vinifera TaxID=29760 RepID=D7T3H0_VITVI